MIKTYESLKDNWLVFDDIDILSKYVAKNIMKIANNSIEREGRFTIVLAGGSSFSKVYKILNNLKSDWSKWHIFVGDERYLPLGDEDRNDRNINQVWLDNSNIPKANIHFIRPELGLSMGANKYEKAVSSVKRFDVVLLGMGNDGHTASLFPGHYYEDRLVVIEKKSPKSPAHRISMSYSALNRSEYIFKVVCGSDKKHAVDLWMNGQDLPISRIHGMKERVYVCQDCMPKKYIVDVNIQWKVESL